MDFKTKPTLNGAPLVVSSFAYRKDGAINAASTGTERIYNDTGRTLTITAYRSLLKTSPSTTAVVVDLRMNGASVYGINPANRPSIAVGATSSVSTPDTVAWPNGSYLTIDVVQGDAVAADLRAFVTAT